MFDLNKILPCEPLEPKIYVLCGPTGAGKTSLGSAKVIRDYKKNHKQRFLDSLALVQMLKNGDNSFKNLRLDHNLYFCSNYLKLDKKTNLTAWDVDFTRLGIPNSKYKVQNIPYGAVLFFPELDQLCNANDNRMGLNEFLRTFLKYHRHNNLTLILDMQDFSRLAKEFRKLVHKVIFVRKKKTFTFFKIPWKTKWYTNEIDMSYLNLMNSLEQFNIEIKEKSYMRRKTFTFYGNIHEYYDHQSGLAYFLNDLDHYDYISSPQGDFTKEGITKFVQAHPITPPDSFKKNSKVNLENIDENIKKKVTNLTKQFKEYLYQNLKGENNVKKE